MFAAARPWQCNMDRPPDNIFHLESERHVGPSGLWVSLYFELYCNLEAGITKYINLLPLQLSQLKKAFMAAQHFTLSELKTLSLLPF